jgi:hypothetical protein
MNCNELQEGAKPQRYVVKRPKALQWFYKGQLYKENDEERQAGRFELFLDLLCMCTELLPMRPSMLSLES